MKKTLLALLSIMIVGITICSANAKIAATTPETAEAIKLYKSGNYTEAYLKLTKLTAKEADNALAKYYLAMTCVKLGKRTDAIINYDAVMGLSPNGVLGSYAKKGKRCVEDPYRCHEPEVDPKTLNDTEEDRFIKGSFGSGFSDKARSLYEKQKMENLKREINRRDEIEPQRFKEYKDYSSQMPSNDDIVAAIRVLQKAGLTDNIGIKNWNSDISLLTGNSSGYSNYGYNLYNLPLTGTNNNSNLSPQVIQALLTTQMTANF